MAVSKARQADLNLMEDALSGRRGETQQRIAEFFIRMCTILLKKNKDYGASVWKRPRLCKKVAPREGIMVRLSDKFERLEHLLNTDGQTGEVDESVEETLHDVIGYSALWILTPDETLQHLLNDERGPHGALCCSETSDHSPVWSGCADEALSATR
jgi:hypothetical protein